MKAISMSRIWLRARQSAVSLWCDHNAIAATEFAVIVPLMLVMFFGTIEYSSGVAVDRKSSLVARTLSDLTSQSWYQNGAPVQNLTDSVMTNVFTATMAILQPYAATPAQERVSEIYVDSTKTAWIQWSRAATFAAGATQATLTTSSRSPGDNVTTLVPAALLVKQTYLILSEVSYLYQPTIGYVMAPSGVTLADSAYTRPRQFACLSYTSISSLPNFAGVTQPACPTP
jgi:Flp pilus assembly protein TadG